MVWYVCPESVMARLSSAYSMVSCPRVSLFRPPALIHARGRIFAPRAPKRVETAWEGPCGAQEAPGPRKIWFRRTGREKRDAESHSNQIGGDFRRRRSGPWMFRPKARLDRRPGSTDCPGTGMQKSESRFEAGEIRWSGDGNRRIRLPIDRCC